MTPATSALDFLKRKKLKPGFDYRDVWQEEHHIHFTVAKAMRLDVLENIYQAVVVAEAEGKTLRQFAKELTPLLQKKGWWGRQQMHDPLTGEIKDVQLGSPRRLKVIYQTNLRTARAAGQWGRIERNKPSYAYLLYELGPSRTHRDEHVAWAGVILPVDHPFWETRYPPNGWGCKCRVRPVSQAEYDRLKGTSKYMTDAPPEQTREWVNQRTGEVESVTQGVHPAFNYHIGKHRLQQSYSLIRNKINASQSDLALGTVSSLLKSQVFTDWFKQPTPDSRFVIAALDENLKGRLKAKQKAVLLSEATLVKQKRNHPELKLDEYQLIPEVIAKGKVIQAGEQNLYFYAVHGRLYKVVVKRTEDRQENYLTTFHRKSIKQLNSELAKGKLLRNWDK